MDTSIFSVVWMPILGTNKSDTFHTFIQFQKMAELQLNCKLKDVQIDGGGE